MKTQKIVTKESLLELLKEKDKSLVIGRALVAIYNNQTDDEQNADQTIVQNGIGFTGADSYSGSLTAKSFLKYGRLLDWQIEKWMKPNKNGFPRICKYAEQLNHIAVLKQSKSL